MKSIKRIACAGALVIVALLGPAGMVGSQVESAAVLDPNLATEEDLLTLPHFHTTLVKGIIERRPFLSMVDLHGFLSPQLNKEQLSRLYVRLFVPINLNTATREEILLVPGVGPRMAREFEEYRPYRGLARFRREIGKYVDAAEVARLERYVFVPVDLNTASDEEILRIPGVGRRMLREFKEYRPYRSIDQFRREIGKYVSDKEVARLERYVTLD